MQNRPYLNDLDIDLDIDLDDEAFEKLIDQSYENKKETPSDTAKKETNRNETEVSISTGSDNQHDSKLTSQNVNETTQLKRKRERPGDYTFWGKFQDESGTVFSQKEAPAVQLNSTTMESNKTNETVKSKGKRMKAVTSQNVNNTQQPKKKRGRPGHYSFWGKLSPVEHQKQEHNSGEEKVTAPTQRF